MKIRHLALLSLTLAAQAAHAGRPLATEDADVLERGACEWESFAAHARADGEPSARGWTTQVGCGIGWRSQLALAYSRARSDGVTGEGLLLGGKTQLIPRDDQRTGWTLAWGLAGAKEDGGSFEHETSYLNLVATHTLAEGLTGHANLGWVRSESADASSTTWNLALEKAVGAGVDLMGEVYGDDRSDAWLGLGARWTPHERFSVNASWARQGGSAGTTLWTLGFKLAF
ncbi:MAG: hypothetical protein KF788_21525 [Piscinibacter sp.]|nr:hypothetical protein [Piscinibacter sp.]